jgi:hypothetical protein
VTFDKGEAPPNSRVKARRGRPFKPGNDGRKPGQKNRATLLIESLLEGEAERLGRRLIDMAHAGDTVAMKIAMDRLAPRRSGRPTPFKLPPVETAADLPQATAALLAAVASGELTAAEAAEIGRVLDVHMQAINLGVIEQRLAALENERE